MSTTRGRARAYTPGGGYVYCMNAVAEAPQDENDRYLVVAAARTLDILDSVAASTEPLTVTEIAARVGLPRPTTYRLVRTLQASHWLERDGNHFKVGFKGFQLGAAAGASLEVRTVSLPFLVELRDSLQRNVQVAKLVQWQVVYLERVLSADSPKLLQARAGAILPAHCTGLGKVLLAHRNLEDVAKWATSEGLAKITPNTITDVGSLLEALYDIRSRGYGVEDGERQPEVACIAAPLRDFSGEVVAAISTTGLRESMPRPLIGSDMAHEITQVAGKISAALGYSGSPRTR